MTLLLKQIFGLLKLLNSETGHNQIAAGLAFGIVLGFAPIVSLQAIVVLIFIFFFRVQIGAAFLSAFFFKFVAYLIDPIADPLGRSILENEAFRPLFVQLYNMPLVPLTRFNNSVTMGAGVLSFVLAPLAFFGFRALIVKYRVHVLARFQETKFWKLVKATAFYKWYATYESLKQG